MSHTNVVTQTTLLQEIKAIENVLTTQRIPRTTRTDLNALRSKKAAEIERLKEVNRREAEDDRAERVGAIAADHTARHMKPLTQIHPPTPNTPQ